VKFAAMKRQLEKTSLLPTSVLENSRIYYAIIASGVAILLMILAEMKFFGS